MVRLNILNIDIVKYDDSAANAGYMLLLGVHLRLRRPTPQSLNLAQLHPISQYPHQLTPLP